MLVEAGMELLSSDIVPDVPLLRFKRGLGGLNYRVAHVWPNLFATEGFFVGRPMRSVSSR
jgi:hypothetical protein